MSPEQTQHLLEQVARGTLSPQAALQHLQDAPFANVGDFAKLDQHRQLRTGFPEAIWGQNKTPAQIASIMRHLAEQQRLALATRIDPEVFSQIRRQLRPYTPQYNELARLCYIPAAEPAHYKGIIGVVSAGTSDLPVAEEAATTAELCGFEVQRLWDVGVAGIHRLLEQRQFLYAADVLIVVAGMEGALASVVGGLVACPIVAVPTSVGYGASFGGLAALLSMLNACAAGIGVVNIDNGFGAGILAAQILRTANRLG